ncbi:hypothetical protein [Scytonema hofmannii]|nr:hypothetical protein [Scytonema hofmannii]
MPKQCIERSHSASTNIINLKTGKSLEMKAQPPVIQLHPAR